MSKVVGVRDVYLTCKECTHTVNIHSEVGCGAHNCSCKEKDLNRKK